MALIIFTHGLGASEKYWGSTIDLANEHEDLDGHTLRTWSYRTSKLPDPPFLRRVRAILRGWKHQSLPEIGEQLWSNLRSWSDGHDSVILVGHSMGGLVAAAALAHGFSTDEDQDKELCSKVQGLICIATPFGGVSLVKKALRFYNQNIADVSSRSKRRRRIVLHFTHILEQNELQFILMRAANDQWVLPGEVTQPFSWDQYRPEVLEGNHSSCIKNLTADHPNMTKLSRSIRRILDPTIEDSHGTEVLLFPTRAVTIKPEYDDRLSLMRNHLDVLAWSLVSFREDHRRNLAKWVNKGIQVRLLLVNPDTPAGEMLCELQDTVEGRPTGSTAGEISTFLSEVRPIVGGLEVRVSDLHPGTNIFRVDGEIFFGPYLADDVSRNAPTGIVSEDHWLYYRLLAHFEWMWNRGAVSLRSSFSDLE